MSTCEHELVSRSLTIATLPLLVLTRRRSHSLNNDISEATKERSGTRSRLASHRSDSFDSLNLGRASLKVSRSPQTVPRIIVISPTSESSFINRDSGEESVKAIEDNVFVSSTFSSEVFERIAHLTNWMIAYIFLLQLTLCQFVWNHLDGFDFSAKINSQQTIESVGFQEFHWVNQLSFSWWNKKKTAPSFSLGSCEKWTACPVKENRMVAWMLH